MLGALSSVPVPEGASRPSSAPLGDMSEGLETAGCGPAAGGVDGSAKVPGCAVCQPSEPEVIFGLCGCKIIREF